MSAKFTLEGSGSGAVKVIEQTNSALDKTEKTAERAAKAASRLEEQLSKQAQRIKESINPQEKLNRLYQELGQHVQAKRLTLDQATQAGVKYRQELGLAAKAGNDAFGPVARSQVGQYLASILSVSGAISLATKALRENAQVRESAAQKALQARAGLGSLSQLASSEANPQAAYNRLVTEAMGFVSSGAAADPNDAGNLLFQLAGAGLNQRDRAFAARLRASGTLTNVGGAAEAYSALTTALGQGEVGTFAQFMSKSLKAAGPAPGSFEQLPIAAARAGGSAKALGISDEFLLAATTLLGKQTGSIDEGGTMLAAFLREVEKSGLKGVQGIGGVGIVEKIAALPTQKQGIGGVLGERAEAVAAFRTLRDNLPALRSLAGDVGTAQDANLAGLAAGLTAGNDITAAAIARARAEGDRDTAQTGQFSARRNLIQALRAERRAALAERGGFGAEGGWRSIIEGIEDFFNLDAEITRSGFQLEEARAAGGGSPFSPETTKLIEAYLRRTAEATEKTERTNRSRATTRQE